MLFYSFRFLAFLPLVFVVYWGLLRAQATRKVFLALASYIFYMSWNPKLILLLWGSTTIDYFSVRMMGRTDNRSVRRALLAVSLIFNLGILALFKYANFLIDNAGVLAGWLGHGWSFGHVSIVLPLGISFYTFETISYVVDGYYGRYRPCRTLADYGLFISFFPHLISGPIVRPKQFLPQIETDKRLTGDSISVGMSYFLYGLVKKLVIADGLSRTVDLVFADPRSFGALGIWLGVIAYAMQIYCDFSGYSNMAYGLARLFDYQLPINFRAPYLSRNVSEFWRRWHISLSTWLRDYLYAPLRGEGRSEFRVYGSLFMTMLLGGLWHGANWTFVAWGAFHGVLLMAHRLLNQRLSSLWKPLAALAPQAVRDVAARVFVFALVCIGWVFFRAATLGRAAEMIPMMIFPSSGSLPGTWSSALLLIVCAAGLDAVEFWGESRGVNVDVVIAASSKWVRLLGYAIAVMVIVAFSPFNVRPFIYFQF